MDDASATDNCGEVTIDVVETTIAGACAGDLQYERGLQLLMTVVTLLQQLRRSRL